MSTNPLTGANPLDDVQENIDALSATFATNVSTLQTQITGAVANAQALAIAVGGKAAATDLAVTQANLAVASSGLAATQTTVVGPYPLAQGSTAPRKKSNSLLHPLASRKPTPSHAPNWPPSGPAYAMLLQMKP
jgi:hypothetical protein